MKKLTKIGAAVILAIHMTAVSVQSVNGMGSPPAVMKDSQKEEQESLGYAPEEMTSRNMEYEKHGEMLFLTLQSHKTAMEPVDTGLSFGTMGDAGSFGRYFYRYIYLGKEPVSLYVKNDGSQYSIYVSCADPQQAVMEHGRALDKLMEVVKACEGMNEWDKVNYFYSWIFDNVSYDNSAQKKTVYEAVTEGSSVCWGYVSAFLVLCRNADLVCEPVYQGNHAWNRVWIGGEWRYCDITWDKSMGVHKWVFISQQEMDADSWHKGL